MSSEKYAPRLIIRRALRRTSREISRILLAAQTSKADRSLNLKRLGSDYGGWWIPAELVRADWVCYCAGVGLDATFDIELAETKGCQVFSFDPTPFAIEYMNRLDSKFVKFFPWGFWNEDKTLTFFAPSWSENESHSIYDLHYGEGGFAAPCYRLSSIMEKLGHERLDLLKLDIEGSWGEVLEDMLASSIFPTVLCVEFDSPAPPQRVLSIFRQLKAGGYRLCKLERDNALFVNSHVGD